MIKLIIILVVIIIVAILALFFFCIYNKLKYLFDKTLYAEKLIKNELDNKLKCLVKINAQAKKTLRAKKDYLTDINSINDEELSANELDSKLTGYNTTVLNLLSDYAKLANNKEMKKSVDSLYEIDEKLDAAKTYFNNSTSKLISSKSKFPASFISKIIGIKIKPLFNTNEDVKKDSEEL